MRDRLIELLTDNLDGTENPLQYVTDELVEPIADHLIANGVILPPCKVGDKIYYPYEYGNRVLEKEVRRIIVNDDMWLDVGVGSLPFENVGKTASLTKEDAEKALRKEDEGK